MCLAVMQNTFAPNIVKTLRLKRWAREVALDDLHVVPAAFRHRDTGAYVYTHNHRPGFSGDGPGKPARAAAGVENPFSGELLRRCFERLAEDFELLIFGLSVQRFGFKESLVTQFPLFAEAFLGDCPHGGTYIYV
jgi:hypothetical protein